MIELVLGGIRSGKSRYAEQQASASEKPVIYIATAEARDAEMQSRISSHQKRRPKHWQTVEEPVKLAKIINNHNNSETCLLVDCLTLWLSNILFNQQGELQHSLFKTETKALYKALSSFSGHLILVSNEIGLAVIPMDKMTRYFVDETGLLHQQIASLSNRVVLVTAGLPQVLK
ncbi:MAG: bifunctional adenosylcobinamide kinase/adenosylcobinamide-phosphate guanylyltransferase [Methylococcales symbiont of Iophon sp. n. MRB-2018]|nr:MAG: bifunctional adenosylcobinamide kinase/adenosylcobinamide-phosphate guanylyltransferase [Methylococcales symbiont of Iophon sp. n. MRB-2018]KAF3979874.1 MAG: bifunctional adenosylcobinamide kinase/adenosylcobinamide-phosphate guanylyltransferase [Methylococcales symbiont of Iophon sp. n. MRB-2018]